MIQLVELLNTFGRWLVNTFAAAESHLSRRVRRILKGPVGKTTLWLSVAAAVALVVIGCLGLPTAAERKAAVSEKDKEKAKTATTFRYGFRYNPMKFVEDDRSLQGALVRTFVFERPTAGDAELIAAERKRIIENQKPDGTIDGIIRLLELGCSPDRPQVKRAVTVKLAKPEHEDGTLGVYQLHTACLAGAGDRAVVEKSLRKLGGEVEKGLRRGCPWTPVVHMKALHAGQRLVDTSGAVRTELAYWGRNINDAGGLDYKDPWGLVDVIARVDYPEAKPALQKLMPMVLRAQKPDGGWGGASLSAFLALKRHGLLDVYRRRAPLPADWRIVRSIPAPPGKLFSMAWDGAALWVYRKDTNQAIRVSPQDGRVLKTTALPVKNIHGIGWWDDSLAAVQSKPKRLLKLDPATGAIRASMPLAKMHWVGGVAQVGKRLWVGDQWMPCIWDYDPSAPGKPRYRSSTGPPAVMAAVGDKAVWHDTWVPLLIQSGPRAAVLDWGEKPFGGKVDGLAFDGEDLWALDVKNKRICIIQKTESGKELTARLAATRAPGREPAVPGAPSAAKKDLTMNVKREGNKVWIEGALNYDNADAGLSHVRTIACYLRNRGHKVDFDWLMGVSGEAFCYYYHPDGTFLSAMVHSYDVTNAALGPYGYRGRWERAAAGNDVQVILQSLEAHLSEGRPPIVPGALPSANMINSQCNRWFLMSGVDRRAETVTLLGAGREPVTTKLAKGDHPSPAGPHPCWYGMIRHVEPGRSDCIYGPDRPILVVERTGEPASRRTAALAGLRHAVLRARETAAVAKRGWGAGTYLAGHAALQRLREDLVAAEGRNWEEFQRVNRPKGDPFRGLADELEHLHLLSARRRSASRFATAAAKALGAEAREHLLAAAKHYDGAARAAEEAFRIRYGSIEELRRIQDLFQPGKDGDPRWKAYWQRADGALGDPAKRRAMAAKIGAALAAEQAALAAIEKALAAEGVEVPRAPAAQLAGAGKPGGNVKREGGRVWIEGVPNEQIGGGWLAMLRGVGVLLKHRGEEVTEPELLAYSGDAFHLCFADKWQYMGYMAIPTDIVANVLSAYGYDGGLHHSEPMPKGAAAQKDVTAKLLAAFRAEIEAGRPVLVGGSSEGGCCDWSVVVGYEKPTGKLCHMGIGKPYRWTGVRSIDFPLDGVNMGTCWNSQTRGTAKPNFVGGWIDNAHVILGRKVAQPDERTRAVAVLQRAVELHRAPTHDPRWGWKFYFGATAYEQWAGQLHKLDYPADTRKPKPKAAWDLYDLGEMARMIDTIVRGRAAAADFCEKAGRILPKAKEGLPAAAKAYREEVAIAKKAFGLFLTGTRDQQKAWLSNEANRQAGVAAVRQMLEKERAAIAAIEKALAAEGVEISKASAGPAPGPPKAARIDYSKLKLAANGHVYDSFSLTMQAAAKLLGKRADYETIYVLSTNAFAPCVDPQEPSIHWRHTSKGRGLGVDIVAGTLGLALRELPQPDHSADPKKPAGAEATARWLRDYYRKPMIKPIREAFEAGQVVIVGGSWNSHPPSGGLNPWCWWGIVLEARDDGEILGASLNGRRDNPLECTCRGCWAVTAAKPTLTPHEADIRMLRKAVARTRGDAKPFLPTQRTVFGLAAMDLWIAQMKQVPYCGDCGKGRSLGCAYCCAQPTFKGAEAVRDYLRKRKDTFAAKARPHIEAAAKHYDEILNLLRPALTGKGGDQYDQIIGNLAKQKTHAEKVLRPVKAELAAAADAMEKALAAEGVKVAPAEVPATGAAGGNIDYSKLKFEGNGHTQDSFSLAACAAARLLGKDLDYERVYCLSSNAFSPSVDPGEDCTAWWHVQGRLGSAAVDAVAAGTGLKIELLKLPPEPYTPKDPKDVFERKFAAYKKQCAPIIRAAMQRGVVLMSGGWRARPKPGVFVPWCWWGILTHAPGDGDFRGACLRGHPRNTKGVRDVPPDYLATCWVLSRGDGQADPHAMDIRMLRNAVARSRGTGPFAPTKRGVWGLKAMDRWIAEMKKVPFCGPCHESNPPGVAGCAVNNFQTTVAGARAAASYLRKRKAAFAPGARPHVETAAQCYDRIVALLSGPMTPKGWQELRASIGNEKKQQAYAKRIEQARAELAAAADAMEKALAAEGVTPGEEAK